MTVHAERVRLAARRHLSPWTWLGIGTAVGFSVPFLFADVLDVQREVYYGIYAVATIALLAAWLRDQGRSLGSFIAHRSRTRQCT